MQYINTQNYIQTTDQSTVVCLYHLGTKIESIDRSNPKRVVFIFKKSKKVLGVMKKLDDGTLKVEPVSFLEDLKKVKGKIYQNINY